MALSLAVADVLSPAGPLVAAALWPDLTEDQVSEIVTAYITNAAARVVDVADAAAQRAAGLKWVEVQAYRARYVQLLSTPATVAAAAEGSSSRFWSQIEAWKTLADDAVAAFDDMLAEADVEGAEIFTTLRSYR